MEFQGIHNKALCLFNKTGSITIHWARPPKCPNAHVVVQYTSLSEENCRLVAALFGSNVRRRVLGRKVGYGTTSSGKSTLALLKKIAQYVPNKREKIEWVVAQLSTPFAPDRCPHCGNTRPAAGVDEHGESLFV